MFLAVVFAALPMGEPTSVEEVEVRAPKPVVRVDRRAIAVVAKHLKSQPNVVICKARQATGTRLPTPPVCKTNIEWVLTSLETRRMLERGQAQR